MTKTNGALSRGQKSKYPAVALGLSLAMAAPAFAAAIPSAQDGSWGSYAGPSTTWVGGAIPADDSDTTVLHNVTIGASDNTETQASITIAGGGSLTQTSGNHIKVTGSFQVGVGGSGTLDLQAGSMQLYPGGLNGMVGDGTNTGLIKVSGTGVFAIGRDGVDDGSSTLTISSTGTLEMIGSNAKVIGDGSFDGKPYAGTLLGTGTVAYTADALGVSSIDTYLGNATSLNLDIDLSAFTGSGDLTLMNIGLGGPGDPVPGATQGAFASVTVDGVDISLSSYSIDYAGGDGNDVVLVAVPEPATMSLLALGGLALLRRRRRA